MKSMTTTNPHIEEAGMSDLAAVLLVTAVVAVFMITPVVALIIAVLK